MYVGQIRRAGITHLDPLAVEAEHGLSIDRRSARFLAIPQVDHCSGFCKTENTLKQAADFPFHVGDHDRFLLLSPVAQLIARLGLGFSRRGLFGAHTSSYLGQREANTRLRHRTTAQFTRSLTLGERLPVSFRTGRVLITQESVHACPQR